MFLEIITLLLLLAGLVSLLSLAGFVWLFVASYFFSAWLRSSFSSPSSSSPRLGRKIRNKNVSVRSAFADLDCSRGFCARDCCVPSDISASSPSLSHGICVRSCCISLVSPSSSPAGSPAVPSASLSAVTSPSFLSSSSFASMSPVASLSSLGSPTSISLSFSPSLSGSLSPRFFEEEHMDVFSFGSPCLGSDEPMSTSSTAEDDSSFMSELCNRFISSLSFFSSSSTEEAMPLCHSFVPSEATPLIQMVEAAEVVDLDVDLVGESSSVVSAMELAFYAESMDDDKSSSIASVWEPVSIAETADVDFSTGSASEIDDLCLGFADLSVTTQPASPLVQYSPFLSPPTFFIPSPSARSLVVSIPSTPSDIYSPPPPVRSLSPPSQADTLSPFSLTDYELPSSPSPEPF